MTLYASDFSEGWLRNGEGRQEDRKNGKSSHLFSPLLVHAWHTIHMDRGTTISHRHKSGRPLSEALSPAMTAADAFAAAQALATPAIRRLKVIVEELVANLIDHAAQGRDLTFKLSLTTNSDTLGLMLEDDGEPFDPRAAPETDRPDPDRGGGVGLALVKAWADIVAYESNGGWNRLKLRIRL